MSEFGEQLDLPLKGEHETKCRHTGDIYRLVRTEIQKLER